MIWPAEQDQTAQEASEVFVERGAARRANGLLVSGTDLFDLSSALAESGVGPMTVTRPDYVFESNCPAADALAGAVLGR